VGCRYAAAGTSTKYLGGVGKVTTTTKGRSWSLIGPVARGGILLAATTLTGWIFLGAVISEISLQRSGARPGADFGLAVNGSLLGYLFVSLMIRLLRRDLTIPPWRLFVRNVLIGYGRAWLIGIGVLAVLTIVDAARSFGAPSPNGSYAADAIFFAVGMLVFAFPGLVALDVGKRLARTIGNS
jgi:hypothetical protein